MNMAIFYEILSRSFHRTYIIPPELAYTYTDDSVYSGYTSHQHQRGSEGHRPRVRLAKSSILQLSLVQRDL